MPVRTPSLVARFFRASKPASFPKLLVPAVLGQALAIAESGEVRILALAFGIAFAAFDLLFIVYLNDWADQRVDAIKRHMFPDTSSPKTIIDGLIPARTMLAAGASAGAAAVLVAFAAEQALGRPGLGSLGLLALGLFAAYSLPPIRLNYRGGGELLEALGVGIALPWFEAYTVAGRWLFPGLVVLSGLVWLSLASAVASGLADEQSDRAGGKKTVASRFGNRAARRATELSMLVGAVNWIALGVFWPEAAPPWAVLPASLFVLWQLRKLVRLSGRAVTGAFDAQRRYKGALHAAIWGAGLLLAGSVIALHASGSKIVLADLRPAVEWPMHR